MKAMVTHHGDVGLGPGFVSKAFIEEPDNFHTLVQDLSRVLGPSSGIDSADVDPDDLVSLMQNYTSNEVEWASYALGDNNRGYTRNLIDRGNGKSNLVG